MASGITMRPARADEVDFLLPLINRAAEGLAVHIWAEGAADGQDPWDWARWRMAQDAAGISWKKGWVAEVNGEPAGCLFAHAIGPDPQTDEGVNPLFRPLDELEALAGDTGYVFILSTLAAYRGRGVGSALLELAEARYRGPRGMSLIVSDANHGGRRLYERRGYREVARRPMVKGAWDNPGKFWILMIKP